MGKVRYNTVGIMTRRLKCGSLSLFFSAFLLSLHCTTAMHLLIFAESVPVGN